MLAIKGMEIPKSCSECPLKANDYVCGLLDCAFSCHYFKERNYNCPLVEIITCKDCKYYRNKDGDEWCTTHSFKDNKFYVREDYHCADGEKKERNK